MSMAPSTNGFLLLDGGFNLIAANDPALQILSFPSGADRIKQPKVFLADRVRTTLSTMGIRTDRLSSKSLSRVNGAISARTFESTVTDIIPFSPLSLCCWSGPQRKAMGSQKSLNSLI